MKPVRLLKRLGAALAAGLLALGLVAGTASAANADGTSGEINQTENTTAEYSTSTSGEIN